MTDLETLVRKANPVPHEDQLEARFGEDLSRRLLGHVHGQEEGRMTDVEQRQGQDIRQGQKQETGDDARRTGSVPVTPQRTRRRPEVKPIPAVAAGLVVLVFLVPLLMVVSDWRPFTSGAPSPVEIAEAYIEAMADFDAERVRALVSDDFSTNEPPDGFDRSGVELALEQHRAYGFRYSDVECESTSNTPELATVRCTFRWTLELHRIGDYPPSPVLHNFWIVDGMITRVAATGYIGPYWDLFVDDFLGVHHPEFRSVVLEALRNEPEAVRTLVELLPQYLELYEQWVADRQE